MLIKPRYEALNYKTVAWFVSLQQPPSDQEMPLSASSASCFVNL